jgi:hypothetical protein
MPRPSKCFFSSDFLTRTFYAHLFHACYMPCLSCHPSFVYINNIWWRVHIFKLFTSHTHTYGGLLCSLHQPLLTSCFNKGSNILHTTLFSDTLNLCSSLWMRDQVSHTHKMMSIIIVLYVLIFMHLSSRQEDNSELHGTIHAPHLIWCCLLFVFLSLVMLCSHVGTHHICGFLKLLSLVQTIEHLMVGWLRNNELEGMWKEAVVA